MYTKSIIQQTVESMRAKDSLRTAIEHLMEKYNIEDSVFVLKNGFMHEVVEGYFVTENDYNNLDEAISACDINTMGIRVMGNNFQTGKIYNRLSECVDTEKKVFDLKRLENVR
jgi:hypothetical protein